MKPYVPELLPIKNIDFVHLFGLASKASAALAEYNGSLKGIINPEVLLSPLTSQEAVLSSKIEGTQATIEEVLEHQAGKKYGEEKEKDIQEILNYRKALVLASEHLRSRPIRLGLVLELHKILLNSVRGQDKSPGAFRKDQNWIGSYGTPTEQASFVPPNPIQLLDHLQKWEEYLEFDDVDPLVQAAIVHAQFELLHPFKDGNGRIGRLIIPLFLYSKGRLSAPMFYLSSYLETHREEYYEKLRGISQDNQWTSWIEFFLKAILAQSKENIEKVNKILDLYDSMKSKIQDITHSQYSLNALDAIFDRPIFQTADFIKRSSIPRPSAICILRQLKQSNILTTIKEGAGRNPAILGFLDLLKVTEERHG